MNDIWEKSMWGRLSQGGVLGSFFPLLKLGFVAGLEASRNEVMGLAQM